LAVVRRKHSMIPSYLRSRRPDFNISSWKRVSGCWTEGSIICGRRKAERQRSKGWRECKAHAKDIAHGRRQSDPDTHGSIPFNCDLQCRSNTAQRRPMQSICIPIRIPGWKIGREEHQKMKNVPGSGSGA
jgi:hypothetical protein